MAEAVLITGGNMGDVCATLCRCNKLLGERVGKIVRMSSVVSSEPWGFRAEQNFLNQVVVVSTQLSPLQVLQTTQQIERELGRTNKSNTRDATPVYTSRRIDIDILFYDQMVMQTPELTIPHPLLQERDFVLTPLCQVEGRRIHPILGKSMETLKNRLKNNDI